MKNSFRIPAFFKLYPVPFDNLAGNEMVYVNRYAILKIYRHLEAAINCLQERIVDLMAPFRRNYRLPEMHGSHSLKNILPALVPELDYELLEISNGGDASAAFYNLKDETDMEKIAQVRNALLEYCRMNTMVRVLEKLLQI